MNDKQKEKALKIANACISSAIEIAESLQKQDITKGSTLLATIRSEFPESTAKDLEDELHAMIDKALSLPVVLGRSEQLCECYDSHQINEVEIIEICCRCKKPTT